MDTISEFLARNGIPESDLVLDGLVKTIDTDKFKGWYRGSDLGAGRRSLTIENWKTRNREFFIEGIDVNDPEQKAKMQELAKEFEAEKLRLQLENKKMAQKHFAKMDAKDGVSKYLVKKGITETFGARTVVSDAIGFDTVIPIHDAKGEMWNYQTIQENGFKTFVPGARIDGLWFELLKPNATKDDNDTQTIFICEGFATACSVQMAMPYSRVMCAFSGGNLLAVAEQVRGSNGNAHIILAGDDDWKVEGHPGREKAEAAAKAVKGTTVFPRFPTRRGLEDTDFNDLMQRYDLETVMSQLTIAANEAVTPTKEWTETFTAMKNEEEKTTKQASKNTDALARRVESLNAIDPYINGVKPMEMRENKQGNKILPNEFVAATALYKYYEGRTVISEETIFIYQGTHWKEVDNFNESQLHNQLQVLYGGEAPNSRLKATYEQFVRLIPKAPRNLFEPSPYVVNFQNGTLHVERKDSVWGFRFDAHRKDDFCTHVIPIDYDVSRKIRNEEFEAMLGRVFGENEDGEDKIKAVRQMYGACVAPIFPHLFMLYGTGGSGKSSLIIPAQRLVHHDNWSAVEPHEFKGFLMESMAGKLVNIVLDINTLMPIEDSTIKKIEDRVPIRFDRKFKNAIKAPLPAIHIFGGNDIPATYEKGSNAHERRWTFLHIEGFKAQGNYSKNFANEVFDSNPQGILNFALDGLEEVLNANGHYHVPESGKEKMRKWQMERDPMALFFHEIEAGEVFQVRTDVDGKITKYQLWVVFKEWFNAAYNKKTWVNKPKFYDEIGRCTLSGKRLAISTLDGNSVIRGIASTGKVDPDGRN